MNREKKNTRLLCRYGAIINVRCYLYAHKDMTLAQDYVQDVLVAIWENLDKLHAETDTVQARLWVWYILRRTLYLDRRQRKVEMVPLEKMNEELSVDPLYDELAVETVLDAQERELWQKFMAGYSVGEIAEELHVSVGSVSQRLYRIRVKLKNEIIEK